MPFGDNGMMTVGVRFFLIACFSSVCICRTPKFQIGSRLQTQYLPRLPIFVRVYDVNITSHILLLLLMLMSNFNHGMKSIREEDLRGVHREISHVRVEPERGRGGLRSRS